MDKDAYYFSHDANARHDPKIVKMLTKYEYGYQWYFMIVEILREQSDYKYKMDSYYGNAIARDLHTNCNTITEFIQDCIEVFDLFKSDGECFWSDSLLRRMEIKEQKSQTYRENAKKRWDKPDINAIAMQLQCSKVKESKGKESKGKHLFSNSPYVEFKTFKEKFYSNSDYLKYDCEYYYEAVKNWSASNGQMKKDWIATAYTWARKDGDKHLRKETIVKLPTK